MKAIIEIFESSLELQFYALIILGLIVIPMMLWVSGKIEDKNQ
jgi:hypothetical protein